MDSKKPPSFTLIFLFISSILFLQSKADGTGSVYFLDSSTHYYFRSRLYEGHVDAEVPKAYQEYCTRHVHGSLVKSDAERQRVIQCIESAIERRVSEDDESFSL